LLLDLEFASEEFEINFDTMAVELEEVATFEQINSKQFNNKDYFRSGESVLKQPWRLSASRKNSQNSTNCDEPLKDCETHNKENTILSYLAKKYSS
jgi:hypothetical protein